MSFRLALKVITLINRQIESGKDIDGNSYKYSTNPFWMPYSEKLAKRFGKKSSRFETVRSSGRLGMIITGGYASVREVWGRKTDGDFLQWSGDMLSALSVLRSGAFESVIGFNSPVALKKAFWLNYSGVGKSRKLWKFFGLSEKSLKELIEYAGDGFEITANLEIREKQ